MPISPTPPSGRKGQFVRLRHQPVLAVAATPKCTSPAEIGILSPSEVLTIMQPVSSMVSKMPETRLWPVWTATGCPSPAASASQRRRISPKPLPLIPDVTVFDPSVREVEEKLLGADLKAKRRERGRRRWRALRRGDDVGAHADHHGKTSAGLRLGLQQDAGQAWPALPARRWAISGKTRSEPTPATARSAASSARPAAKPRVAAVAGAHRWFRARWRPDCPAGRSTAAAVVRGPRSARS